jgi:hypothetical protein
MPHRQQLNRLALLILSTESRCQLQRRQHWLQQPVPGQKGAKEAQSLVLGQAVLLVKLRVPQQR